MKKILSFLTKKPLALAAVALFSMSSFAEETTAPTVEGGTTTTEEPVLTPVEMWAKVSATNPLYYFDRVTVVDEDENVAYADDGTNQVDAVPFKTEATGTALPEGASYFYVAEGSTTDFFALNKSLSTDKDGKFVNSAGDVVEVPEDGAPTEGALGSGAYMDEDGNLVYPSDLVDEVSWNWTEMSSDYYLFTASNRSRFAYYNKAAKRFKTTTTTSATKAKLYKVVTVYAPFFKPGEGYYRVTGDENLVEIVNPNESGKIWWRYADEDDEWTSYEEGGIPIETGVETTLETKIEFEGGETPVVRGTFLFYEIEDPTITPEPTDNDMVDENGEFKVTIATTEEGLKYTIGEGTEVPTDETEVEVNIADGLELPATVTVTAKSTKTITFKGKDVEVASDPATTATYTINAYPAPQEVEFFAESENGAKPNETVDLGENIYLWFTVEQDGYGIEYDGTKDANKKLTLTFYDKNNKEIGTEVVDIAPAEDGRVVFTVPTDEAYANGYFLFDVPEGFYYTYTGEKKANQVPTPEQKDVRFNTGLLASTFILDCDLALDNETPVRTKYLTTDDVYVDFQVYQNTLEQNVEVNFSDEALELQKTDPTLGVKFTEETNGEVTPIEKVEKVEGTNNIFRVFFVNEEATNKYVKEALINEELIQKGYIMGFPAGTFVCGDSKNKDELSAHIIFNEAVELTMKPVRGFVCEGVEGVPVKVTAKGKIFGTDYSTPYWKDKEKTIVNPEKSKVELADDVEVTITGTDIHGDAVEVTAVLQKTFPNKPLYANPYRDYNSKDLFYLNWGQYDVQIEESEDGSYQFVLQQDNKVIGGDDYTVSVPEGAFFINNGESKAFTDKLDVLAHPVWEFVARPYTFDKDGEAKTLVIDGKATLDDLIEGNADEDKTFEKDVRKYLSTAAIKVDGKKIEWDLKDVSTPAQDENDRWFETFVIEISLAEPITDVDVHHVVIGAHSLIANACDNKEKELDVYPEVDYAIQQVNYCISTAVSSVTYYIWATLPDNSYLNVPIQYIGETGEGKTALNAAALNNAENVSECKYPDIETATEVGEFEGHPATLFTVKFTDLKPWTAKMTFPVGTVQAKGYVANASNLWNNITIIPDIEFDATSSWDDFLTPSKPDKKKVYNIGTDETSVIVHLTGYNKYDNTNANKSVQLIAGSELLIAEKAGVTLKVEPIKKATYTVYKVTFLDEDGNPTGLEPGSYPLTVQEHTVINTLYNPDCSPKIGCDNQEAFELTINVENFAEKAEVEITTKTYRFDVPVSDGPITVKEGATATLNGKTVLLEAAPGAGNIGNIRVCLWGPDATACDFIQKPGTYTFEIPANTFEGEYAPCTYAIPVTVDVVFEFVDSNTDEDYFGKDLVSTPEDVAQAVGLQEKMYYTRNFKSTNLQMLNVPFNGVGGMFEIYRNNFVRYDEASGKSTLNYVKLADDEIAYANKPYIIKPTQTGIWTTTLKNIEVVPAVENSDVECSTTTVTYKFNTTTEAKTGKFLTLIKEGGFGTADEIFAWRWYLTSTDKDVKYVKVAINGVDVDGADGIDFVEAAEGDTQIYNVAGQRLNAPAKGKVNIINGKKVFVK